MRITFFLSNINLQAGFYIKLNQYRKKSIGKQYSDQAQTSKKYLVCWKFECAFHSCSNLDDKNLP